MEVIRLPRTYSDIVPPSLQQPIMIRQDYIKALQIIIGLGTNFALVLSGTPGIGKSAFALLVLCWLAALQQKVMYR